MQANARIKRKKTKTASKISRLLNAMICLSSVLPLLLPVAILEGKRFCCCCCCKMPESAIRKQLVQFYNRPNIEYSLFKLAKFNYFELVKNKTTFTRWQK